jgi:branched-chain amino acid aminotransferase
VHMHIVACVLGSGQDATTPTSLYINPQYRGRMTAPDAGLACCVSNWARTSDNAIPIRLKCGANYQNARLALLQAKADGYDSPIFLTQRGKVAEGVGASLFLVRKGKLITPATSNDILESITRTTLIEDIIPDVLGLEVIERDVDRTELYVADEIFFCGSGYEITPITSVDRLLVGDGQVGPITQRVFDTYLALVRGADKRYAQWRTPTYHKVSV